MSGDQSTTNAKGHSGPLEYEVYKRSNANINRLRDRLPEDLVSSLVREVIRRVSTKIEVTDEATDTPTHADLVALSEALIADDDTAASDIIMGLRADGTSADSIYLKHLAMSARMLGDWWSEDRVNFTHVTVATGRMFALMRGMRHLFDPIDMTSERSAVFAAVPGEDHTLGVRMAADIFRKDGWDIELKVGLDHDALVAEIEKNPRGIVGLSISGVHSIEALSKLIVALNISCPQSRIFVSGSHIDEARPMLDLLGLDGMADNIEDAKSQLTALWDQRAHAAV